MRLTGRMEQRMRSAVDPNIPEVGRRKGAMEDYDCHVRSVQV